MELVDRVLTTPGAGEIDNMRERIGDPTYLPTFQEVVDAFPGNQPETAVFRNYCEEHRIFEFFTKEFVDSLGDYLMKRIGEIRTGGKPITILEVGAGRGQLTHWLKKYLDENGLDDKKVKLIATDDHSRGISDQSPFPVEKIDYSDAVTKYKPDFILTSWMPLDEDWTPVFRDEPSVKEYILIGEMDGGSCGSAETWSACPLEEELGLPETDLSSGFYRVELNKGTSRKTGVSHQIARTDNLPLDPESSYSGTVSFRRMNT